MTKIALLTKLQEEKIVAVIRAQSYEEGLKIIDSVVAGGIHFIEITFTVPQADELLKEVAKKYRGTEVVVGAGTILDSETARIAILAGAQFIVSPAFNESLVRLANRYGITVMAGAVTPTEILTCLEYGVDVIKIFPGDMFQPNIVKSFKGPIPQGRYMVTGGISVENINDWLDAGAFAVGTGGSLTEGSKVGDFGAVMSEAKKLVEKIK